jgi:predicted nucleic acid-binding protein
MNRAVYDAGALIAAERGDRELWSDHLARLDGGVVPIVPATVVAQASRSPRQAQLRQLLHGCDVTPFDESAAHVAGELLGRARSSDVVDASVVVVAVEHRAEIVTSDRDDIALLLTAARTRLPIVDV